MARQARTRKAPAAQARSYLAKAEEYLAAAEDELEAKRSIAATSLAIHAAINAADAVCGVRLGKRAAGQDHDRAGELLKSARLVIYRPTGACNTGLHHPPSRLCVHLC